MTEPVDFVSHLKDSRAPRTNEPAVETDFRHAMRQLAGGVSIISVGRAPKRTGFTATSVVSLSVEPARLIVSVNRATSSFPEIERCRCFGVSVLASHHEEIAARFGNVRGPKGEARFGNDCWHPMVTGASLLCDALAAFDCELEEVIERYSHAIIIGRVVGVRRRDIGETLVYWRGEYHDLRTAGDTHAASQWEPIVGSRNLGCG